jgi:3-methyladenine DNA glycosylase AlkC
VQIPPGNSLFLSMEPLKEMFNLPFYQHFARAFGEADRNFNPEAFVRDVTENMEMLSLNERLRKTSLTLQKHLPKDYQKSLSVLYKASPNLRTGYTALVLPDFVGLFGKDHFDLSMDALRDFTALGSSEFAVREFLKTDPARTLKVMHKWAEDDNVHVRRLASEGSRPRLPWSFKLERIIREPSITQGILERLNTDNELYVRKSVANHLNDHSKDNVDYMLQLVKSWDHQNKHTAWIVKHAIRSLIKKGNKDALMIFGFGGDAKVNVINLTIDKTSLQLGEYLQFAFEVVSEDAQAQKLVIDYGIHYAKSSGNQTRKVFKLKEVTMQPGDRISISKKQLFQDLTTRKHYSGKHILDILVNGETLASEVFDLTC